MQQFDYKRIEELYTTLSSIENSGDDVLADIKKEINNEELILLKDEIMPYLAKYIASSLRQLKCQMDISVQYDGQGNLSYSFCKSGSNALIRGNVKSEDLVDFMTIADCIVENAISEKPRTKTETLRVEYPDGRIIQHPKATDTYVEVIENNYPDLIHELNIVHANVNIVAREYSEQYASAQREISNGWLVFTNTNTRKKRDDLIKISNALNIGLKVDIVSVVTGEIIEVDDCQSEYSRQKLKVVFPDGRVIQPNKVLEAVVEVVKYATPEKVRNLNIIVCGDNLILKHPRPRYIKACKPVGDGWLVNTCSNTTTKYEQIMFISEQLNLGITAEIVSKNNYVDYNDDNESTSSQLVLDTMLDYSSEANPGLARKVNEEAVDRGLRIVDFSDKSFVLYGDTSGYEKFLESQYGAYNKHLPEGAGWLFSKKREVVIRDFFKLHSQTKNPNNESLEVLLEQLSQMRTMKNNGIKSPHKAIYVMALIEGIKNGRIIHNKICLGDYLIQTFKDIWRRFVPANTPYTMEIGNPFMHLSAEPFYFLRLKHKVPNFNIGWTVSAVKRVCDYAYVNDEFKRIISSDENCRKIIEHLVNIFGLTDTDMIEHTNENISSSEAGCVPKLPKPNIPNRYGAALFRLTYPSGVCEESDSYLDVYVKFIKYANPQRVRKLGIFSLGANIIATKEEINTRYEKQYKDVGDGYYFNTISTTQRKYEVMSFISSRLNLNVKVELVAKNS